MQLTEMRLYLSIDICEVRVPAPLPVHLRKVVVLLSKWLQLINKSRLLLLLYSIILCSLGYFEQDFYQ